jgi:hypothetical protein
MLAMFGIKDKLDLAAIRKFQQMQPEPQGDGDGQDGDGAEGGSPEMSLINKALDFLKGKPADEGLQALVKTQLAAYAAGHVSPQALAAMIRQAATASSQGGMILNSALTLAPAQIGSYLKGLAPESGDFWLSAGGQEKIAALKAALAGAAPAAPRAPRKPRAPRPPEPAAPPAGAPPA